MVLKNMAYRSLAILYFLYISLLITSCKQESTQEGERVNGKEIRFDRFEKDLFESNPQNMASEIRRLKNKYGSFFDLFAFQITRLGSRDSALMVMNFSNFVNDTNFRALYHESSRIFTDFKIEQDQLSAAFTRYSTLFPEKEIPAVVTLLSVFSYPIVVDSTTLGIGLDMYLGTESKYYYTLDPPLPLFLRNKMRKEYVVPDAMRGWIDSDYGIDESTRQNS